MTEHWGEGELMKTRKQMKHLGKMKAGIMRPQRAETAGQFSQTLSERSGLMWREGNEIALFSCSLTLTITGATPGNKSDTIV